MILCIEDSNADSMTLFGILRLATRRALLFVPGKKEAILALGKLNQPPSMILCDLLMHENGNTTIPFLRDHYPGVPIVVVTGSCDEEREAEAMRNGANRIIKKDYGKPPGLANLLNACLVELGLEPKR